MDDQWTCPGCQAHLVLPALPAGQTVQCPRCQQTFDPSQQRAPARLAAASSKPLRRERETPAEEEPFAFPQSLRGGSLRGTWAGAAAIGLLVLSVCSFGVQAYLNFELSQLDDLDRGFRLGIQAPEVEQRWARWHRLSESANGFHQLIYWPTVLVVLIWLYKTSRNLSVLQARGVAHTPGNTVVSFLVPGMNLYWPYVIVQEIWRASHPRAIETPLSWADTPRSRLIRVWWFFWIAAVVLQLLAYFKGTRADNGFDDPGDAAAIACLSCVCRVVAGVLLMCIIRKITQRQQERYARLYEDAADG